MRIKKNIRKYQKENGKIFSVFIWLAVAFHIVLEHLFAYLIKVFIPVDDSVIIFRSTPDYSDNAQVLAEYMVSHGYSEKYKIYFDVHDIRKYECRNSGITFVSCRSRFGMNKLGSLHLLMSARYLMSTHEMILLKKFKRSGQLNIRLWHGCGYKDSEDYTKNLPRSFDYALVPGSLFVKTKSKYWNVSEEYILPIGYPRYDWLRTEDSLAKNMINSFKKNDKTKVILWMPTYRIDKNGRYHSTGITQFPIVHTHEEWSEINHACIENNIVLIVKLHFAQKQYFFSLEEFSNVYEIDNQLFEDQAIPLYKFIGLTDALITDYSSIGIDYLIVNRPIAFTLDDFDDYKSSRGFVFDDPRVYMPGHHIYTLDDLKSFLKDVSDNTDPYKDQRDKMCSEAICPSTNYCQSILERFGIVK